MLAIIYPDVSVMAGVDEIAARYFSIANRLGPEQYKVLRFGCAKLASRIRRAAYRSADDYSVAEAADRWLERHIGPPNDLLRRATVAMLAAGLSLDSIAMPQSIRDGYPALHAELSRTLLGTRMYYVNEYAQDLMLATGVLVPAGCFLAKNPHAQSIWAKTSLERASAGFVARQLLHYGVDPVREGLAEIGVGFWAEIRLGGSEGFNSSSIQESYCLLADLLNVRPDIAGVCAGSELFLCGLHWGRRELLAWKAEQTVHSQPTDYDSGANRSEGAGG